MTKRTKAKVREDKINNGTRQIKEELASRNLKPSPTAKNDFQREVFKALHTKQVVVISAPAGTGKTFCAVSHAIDRYVKGEVDNIFLARPAVGMGNTLGFLKGSMQEKYEPYLAPMIEVISQRYGRGLYETGINNGNIELIAFEYLRGRNLHGITIVDEFQQCSAKEIYSVLTRLTEGGQLILLGDRTQSDVDGTDAMTWLKRFVDRHDLYDVVDFLEGTSDDIVRSHFVKRIVQAQEFDTGEYCNDVRRIA